MIKKCIRWYYNFKKYVGKKYYIESHPAGLYPDFLQRLRVFWILRNEPTIKEILIKWENQKEI